MRMEWKLLLISSLITQSTSLNLTCTYKVANFGKHLTSLIYQCAVTNDFNITTRDVEIEGLTGNHTSKKEDKDINAIHIKRKIVNVLPATLGSAVPNLIALSVEFAQLREVTKNDLKQFPKLQHLYLFTNELTVVEKDLFEFTPNLRYVNMNKNLIKEVDASVFNALSNLWRVDLGKNKCINKLGMKDKNFEEFLEVVRVKCAPLTKINGTCRTSYVGWGRHLHSAIRECAITDSLNVTTRNTEFEFITGDHRDNLTVANDTGIHITGTTVYYLPARIGELMPNLVGLSVENCKLKEITVDDLKPFVKMQHLWLVSNHVKALQKNLFVHNPELVYINLRDNLIATVHEGAFTHLSKLRHLILLKNVCITAQGNSEEVTKQVIEIAVEECSGKPATTTSTTTSASKINIPSVEEDEEDTGEEEISIETQSMTLWMKVGVIGGIIWLVVGVGCGVYCAKKRCS